MESVLISIRPKWVEKIANGEKTIEVRKSAPKCEVPFKCYIYCTSSDVHSALVVGDGDAKLIHCCNYKSAIPVGGEIGNGKVIGEFICDKVDKIIPLQHTYYNYIGLPIANVTEYGIWNDDLAQMCLKKKEIDNYGKGKMLYGWHISDLKIYDKPKELSEFYTIDESGSDCCIACVYHETPIEEMPCRTCTGERRYLYRPPQSYMYVEEI